MFELCINMNERFAVRALLVRPSLPKPLPLPILNLSREFRY